MRIRETALLCILCVVSSLVPVAAHDAPSVFDLTPLHFELAELGTLVPELVRLIDVVEYREYGSRRVLSPTEWSADDFARYTAGVLQSLGYVSRIVSTAERVYVLVDISSSESSVWVPIDPTPKDGLPAAALGRIPVVTSEHGGIAFDSAFTMIASVRNPATNDVPTARMRVPDPPFNLGETLRFRALAVSDSTDEILLYRWDFGDGTIVTLQENAAVAHAYAEVGIYTITLTIIDARGGCGIFTYDLQAEEPENRLECIPCAAAHEQAADD